MHIANKKVKSAFYAVRIYGGCW